MHWQTYCKKQTQNDTIHVIQNIQWSQRDDDSLVDHMPTFDGKSELYFYWILKLENIATVTKGNSIELCKCRFLILFFHMIYCIFLINRTILFRETSFQQVLLSSSGPKENIFPSNFVYPLGVSENNNICPQPTKYCDLTSVTI